MIKNLVFIKIHKCSSQSVRNILKDHAHQNELRFFSKLKKTKEKYHKKKPLTKKYNIFALHHSYKKDFFEWLIEDPIYITFIREPLERAISHYYYYDIHQNKNNKKSFNDFFKENPMFRQNFMSSYMGYSSLKDITIQNLNKRYKFIGITEKFDESIIKLEQVLDWNIPKPYKIKNTNYSTLKNLNDPSEIKHIFKKYNAIDYKLYDLISRTFY